MHQNAPWHRSTAWCKQAGSCPAGLPPLGTAGLQAGRTGVQLHHWHQHFVVKMGTITKPLVTAGMLITAAYKETVGTEQNI